MTQLSPMLGVDVTAEGSASGAGVNASRFEHVLGACVQAQDSKMYLACSFTSAITANSWAGIDENYAARPLTKAMVDDGWNIGVANEAKTKDKRGWLIVKGTNFNGRVLKSCAADVALYTTATAGVLDDESSGQTKVDGVVAVTAASASATSTGQAVEIIATWPKSTTF